VTLHAVESAFLVEQDLPAPVRVGVPRGTALAFSARCPGREGPNEDAAAIWPLPGGACLLAVADGLGGQRAGGLAARIALECLAEELPSGPVDESQLRASVLDGFEHANAAVLELGSGAGTTLAVAQIRDGLLRTYHVGDSAILLVGQRGKLKLMTVAHSPVGYAVAAGVLDADEALHHEDRHYVSNHVGATDMRIEIGTPRRLAPRDTLLLASDGLLDNLTVPEIAEAIRTGPEQLAAERLVGGVRSRMAAPEGDRGVPSKPDDATFILYRPGGAAK
jgi:serine/threonine protein phosphatase PrpC